jgi:post-segregation antitoxin (ccd killing protein)
MRMSRVNVYLPDELAEKAKSAGLNISGLTQDAIRRALAAESLDAWQDRVDQLAHTGVDHESALAAVREAKDELEGV